MQFAMDAACVVGCISLADRRHLALSLSEHRPLSTADALNRRNRKFVRISCSGISQNIGQACRIGHVAAEAAKTFSPKITFFAVWTSAMHRWARKC